MIILIYSYLGDHDQGIFIYIFKMIYDICILIYFYLGDHDQGGVLQPLAEERDQHPVGDRRANGEEDRHVGVLGRDAKSAFIIFTNFVFFWIFVRFSPWQKVCLLLCWLTKQRCKKWQP